MIDDVQWINNGPYRLLILKVDLCPKKEKSKKFCYFEVIIFGITYAKTIKVPVSKQNVT